MTSSAVDRRPLAARDERGADQDLWEADALGRLAAVVQWAAPGGDLVADVRLQLL